MDGFLPHLLPLLPHPRGGPTFSSMELQFYRTVHFSKLQAWDLEIPFYFNCEAVTLFEQSISCDHLLLPLLRLLIFCNLIEKYSVQTLLIKDYSTLRDLNYRTGLTVVGRKSTLFVLRTKTLHNCSMHLLVKRLLYDLEFILRCAGMFAVVPNLRNL